MLDYFVPYPLTEAAQILPARSGRQDPQSDPDLHIGSVLLLVVLLSEARGGAMGADAALLRLHTQVMAGHRKLSSVDDLLKLGREINPGNDGLRRQIAYSGGPTPSTASHLYPPPSELAELMECLAAFMAEDLSRWDPIDVAVMACEHAVRIHPFNDGNGRWARLLALEAGRRAGSVWAGACAGLVNQRLKKTKMGRERIGLSVSWERCFDNGRDFLLALRLLLQEDGSLQECERIWVLARETVASTGAAIEIFFYLLSCPRHSPGPLGTRFGWSVKKAAGFVERLADTRYLDGFTDRPEREHALVARARRHVASIYSFN